MNHICHNIGLDSIKDLETLIKMMNMSLDDITSRFYHIDKHKYRLINLYYYLFPYHHIEQFIYQWDDRYTMSHDLFLYLSDQTCAYGYLSNVTNMYLLHANLSDPNILSYMKYNQIVSLNMGVYSGRPIINKLIKLGRMDVLRYYIVESKLCLPFVFDLDPFVQDEYPEQYKQVCEYIKLRYEQTII